MQPFPLSRRQFLRLGAGGVVVMGLGACTRSSTGGSSSSSSATSSVPTTSVSSTVPVIDGSPFGGRRLVIVQMNGGNDLLNTLPPSSGRYMDLRPTIAVAEAERIALAGIDDASLHPSLAALGTHWDAGQLAIVRGIGFESPNRSHFVSMDRWWRADDLTGPGWLGVALDTLPSEPPPLFAAALGSAAPVLTGVTVQPTLIVTPTSFRFEGIDGAWLTAAGETGEGLAQAVRHAYARSVEAVAALADITGSDPDDDIPDREGGATIAGGLAVAAQMLLADAGTQSVVVSASGFDTHAGQVATQAALLQDLADGLVAFQQSMEAGGLADDVVVVTTSEFGRRAAENGSGGTDHGAGGLSFALGRRVSGGMYGAVDLDDLLDGDVRPTIDPLALFSDCLGWLGVEADTSLPRSVSPLGAIV